MMNSSTASSTQGRKKGLVFDIQSLCIHDGPGIRTVIFLKGCPLRCEWCCNPESWYTYPQVLPRNARCLRDAVCVQACPVGAITVTEEGRKIDWAKCTQCLKCARVCSNEALCISGTYMTVDEVVSEVSRDLPFFESAGGGVTISGGEPLLQWEFVACVLKVLKKRGIHTAIETSGYAPWKRLEAVFKYADLVLFDLKHIDPQIHKARTGVSNKRILSNLQKTTHKVRTWIRLPLIPGFNESDADIKQIINFLVNLPIEKVSVLIYHVWGRVKWEALGREYLMEDAQPPSEGRASEICKMMESAGLKCTIKY